MEREDALMQIRYARYITADNFGLTRVFPSLRAIQAEYDVNYSTISKALKHDDAALVSTGPGREWLAVRVVQPIAPRDQSPPCPKADLS